MLTRSWLAVCVALGACGDDGDKGSVDGAGDSAADTAVTPDSATDSAPSDSSGDSAPDSAVDTTADTAVEPDTTVTPDGDTADTTDTADTAVNDTTDTFDDDVEDSTERLDDDLEPCDNPEYWPFSVLSDEVPIRVHYRVRADERDARETLAILEHSWQVEVGVLGFVPPLPDDGSCGPDAAFDVFTWRDSEEVFVNIWMEDEGTPWDDGYPYMVVDPWGEYGGDELTVTLAHELNHACQAAHDWSDTGFIYEATSTFIEDEVYDDHNSYQTILFDFQGNPDWSLDRYDDYETWYMYGAALWLRYLRDRWFDGNASFVARLWEGMRSPWDDNEPDYVDSLDALLASERVSFADTVIEFARWRWYVEERDDGMHLEEAGDFPADAVVAVEAEIASSGGETDVAPMMLGTMYVDVVAGAGDPQEVLVTLTSAEDDGDVHWVVQAVPGIGGDDGELLELPARVSLTAVGGTMMRTLIVTALPGLAADIDPDERTDERFRATLEVSTP